MKLLSWLFPPNLTCVVCGTEINESINAGICDECFKSLPFNDGGFCLKCGVVLRSDAKYCLNCKSNIKRFSFDFARSSFVFEGSVAKLIKNYKYDNGKYLAQTFAVFMANLVVLEDINADIIVPVPLCKKRKFSRGFNQSELLAKEAGKILGLPVVTKNLVRIRSTKTQTKLTQKQRDANLDGAFEVLNKNIFKGKSILLVDDVLTTGSTAEHCTKELLKAKAANVKVLTLASTEFELQNS